jgi:hypothetical protein
MRLLQSSRLAEEETKLSAVDAVGGSMRLVQSSRLSEEETMRWLGAVALAFDGSEEASRRWFAVVKALRGGDEAMAWCCCTLHSTARRRLSLGLYDGWRLSLGLYDGSEEAVAWTTAQRRLSLG